VLTDQELEIWKRKLDLNQPASHLVDKIRTSEPARATRGWAGRNVCVRYASSKMGRTIQAESHTCELPFILCRCEFPPIDDVLEYWDQPTTFRLRYTNKNGRNVSASHTPDFFLIHPDKAGFVECKLEETLLKLAKDQPNKFKLDSQGTWHCIPAEEEAEKLGFYYHLFTDAQIDRTLARNIVFLEDFFRPDVQIVPDEIKKSMTYAVSAKEGLTLSELLCVITELGQNSDSLYQLIAEGALYVNLSASALIDREQVYVYSSKEASGHSTLPNLPKPKYVELNIGERIEWGDRVFEIANLNHSNVWLIGDGDHHPTLSRKHVEQLIIRGEIYQSKPKNSSSTQFTWKQLIDDAKPEALKEANRRHALLMKYYLNEPVRQIPTRTLERWSSQYKQAQFLYGNGLVGLIPRWAMRGDRSTQRLPAEVVKLMVDLIVDDYETDVQQGMFVVYGKLILACEEIKKKPPSFRTFVDYVHKRPKHEQDLKRMGSRAAYESEPFYFHLDLATPRHGDRPFEICHIDDTELDWELVHPITGQNFGRPWATFLTDAFCRRILVAYLAYESPSYRSCMMVLRDCVRRFGRLPQTIVTDGGPPFKSTYFECLAASFEVTVKRRPKAKGRHGSVIENSFGVSHKEFVYNLQGNTQLSHNDVRQVTKSHNPRNLAVWSLGPAYEQLCDWAYNRHAKQLHSTLKETPQSLYARTLDLTGHRNHRMISYNEDFRVMTLPTTPRGTAKNILNKGVRINNEYYRHPTLNERSLLEKELPVKYDPYDYSTAWVYVGDNWIKCLSDDHHQLRGVTETELRIRSAERAMLNTAFSRTLVERAAERARGALTDQKREKELAAQLALARAKDQEAAQIRQQINGPFQASTSDPDSTHSATPLGSAQDPHRPSPFEISGEVDTLEEYS
jgi:transposase InsO family protein